MTRTRIPADGLAAGSVTTDKIANALVIDGGVILPPSYSPTAVLLTSGTSYTVPAGAASMKAWAIGSGGTGDGWFSLAGNAGGCAFRTWSVTGGSTVSYTRSDNGNSTVTYGGVTITGNSAPRNSRSTTPASFSGGDGGAGGGVFVQSGASGRGGAVGGNGTVAACGRLPATDVSGLFAALALAGVSTTESCAASAAFGSGGVSTLDGASFSAGIGGGGVTFNDYDGVVAAVTPGVGAVVLMFS